MGHRGDHLARVSPIRARARSEEELAETLGRLPTPQEIQARMCAVLIRIAETEPDGEKIRGGDCVAAARTMLQATGALLISTEGMQMTKRALAAKVRAALPEIERQAAEEEAREGRLALPEAPPSDPEPEDPSGW